MTAEVPLQKSDAENYAVNQKFTKKPTLLEISGSSAEIAAALTQGRYRIVATVDCYIIQGATGLTAVVPTTGTPPTGDNYLPAGAIDYLTVDENGSDEYVAAITDGATGWLCITKER